MDHHRRSLFWMASLDGDVGLGIFTEHAIGDRMQGWLDGTRLLDHRDAKFKTGRVGLWTKADSVTAFQALTVRGIVRSSDGRR